jgi:hypothetical protein
MKVHLRQLAGGAVLALLAALIPATATATVPGDGYGWVTNDAPGADLSVWRQPDPAANYSSVSRGATNWILHSATGSYTVAIDGVYNAGGVAHVTAGDTARCKLAGVAPATPWQFLTVRCYDMWGNLVDAEFTATYTTSHSTSFPFAYLTRSGVSHNSAGFTNSVATVSTGVYRATMPGLGSHDGGTEQVTALGGGNTWCKIADSHPDLTGSHLITVSCFTPRGVPADSDFMLTFMNGGDLLGIGEERQSAYAWVSAPGLSVPETWRYANGTTDGSGFGVTPVSPGVVAVGLPMATFGGNVQVTAYGGGTESCASFGSAGRSRSPS